MIDSRGVKRYQDKRGGDRKGHDVLRKPEDAFGFQVSRFGIVVNEQGKMRLPQHDYADREPPVIGGQWVIVAGSDHVGYV